MKLKIRYPAKMLENLTNEFWEMRSKFKTDCIKIKSLPGPFDGLDDNDDHDPLWFDFPDYYGLSSKVNSRLSGDFVDSLQGDFFGEMEMFGVKAYKKFFHSKRDLGRHLLRIWKIYGLAR